MIFYCFKMSQPILIRPTMIVSLCGSVSSSSTGSIKDFWGVVVPSDFMPSGGGKTILRHSARLRQNCYRGHHSDQSQ